MEGNREQPLLAAERHAPAQVEERPRTQPPVHANADSAGSLDDVDVVRLAARRRDVDWLVDLGDPDKPKRASIRVPARGEGHRDPGRERGNEDPCDD
jgi:hypothetical protein